MTMLSQSTQLIAEEAATDERTARAKGVVEVAMLEAEVAKLREELNSEEQNRRLRYPIAVAALSIMVLQVIAANVIFGWYGDANAWAVPPAAISAWMGTTVVEVVAVVLVVMNYLFPKEHREYA
jgi:uncharacterized membrane protein